MKWFIFDSYSDCLIAHRMITYLAPIEIIQINEKMNKIKTLGLLD